QAAVAFDGTSMKFTVISDKNLLEGIDIGETLDQDGKNLTVLQLCQSVEEAEAACGQRTTQMNSTRAASGDCPIARIVFDEKGDALSECSVEHSDTSSPTEPAAEEAKDDDPLDEMDRETFRDLLMNIIREIDLDIARFKNRKDTFQQIYVQYFGTGPDGSILDDGEGHNRALTRKLGSKFIRRITNRITKSSELFSHMDRLTEARKRRQSYPTRDQRRASKRGRYEDDEDWAEDDRACGSSGTIGRAGKVLTYPYISQEEEQQILLSSNDSASAYAQNLAKVLFADSLDLYFKDQDPSKRQWIHEAVDYRFPSGDRNAHHLKWKNCSSAINKNMRISERGPADKPKLKEVECTYLTREYEEECYRKANKDPVKYAEFMSLKLFEGSWDKFFKEQDAKMKDWLRECVDRRFYIADKNKRDQRWKVCAAACNRNRTKIIGEDGKVNEFPYFPKELEETAFRESNGLPYVYAEAMAKLLFPDTPHLFFKDQDHGKRVWLHEVLDRRFPSRDKLQHVAKWKSCTTAINRNKAGRPPTFTEMKPLAITSSAKSSADKKDSIKDKENKKKDEDTPVSTKRSQSANRRNEKEALTDQKDILKEDAARKERESSRISARAKGHRPEPYTSYPFMTEDEEIECYEAAKRKDVELYARAMGRVLFKDNIKALYKDQDADRCAWFEDILHFRFPTWGAFETKSKVRAAIRAINKNATTR
uniref:Helicase ATP-binding domain-containing protein n=1 Tax=Haemonchus contortus TaxID=6289 RepID=A0A7I5EAE4_HAECO